MTAGFELVLPAWMDDAACAQIGGEFWFPDKGGSIRDAIDTCETCPVAAACLAWAVAIEVDQGRMPGIYGGLAPRQRKPLIDAARKKESAA